MTSTPTSASLESLQKVVRAVLLNARARLGAVVDGADPAHKALRDEAFAASGRRGAYPQLLARAVGGGPLRVLSTVEALLAANEDRGSGALAELLASVTPAA